MKWKEPCKSGITYCEPPHNQNTISSPTKGAEVKLVITVAPQNDICPQGRTGPRKAVPITANRISNPTNQVFFNLKEPYKYLEQHAGKIEIKNLVPLA